MERDKELLLNVDGSDSDDVVEEFKLPPPRTRRPKARKALAEARIAASNQSLISLKCCLIFFLLTIFITGALALAYLILNMQDEIARLGEDMAKVKMQLEQDNLLSTSMKEIREKMVEHKLKFSHQDVNFRLLSQQIKVVNKTVEKINSSTRMARKMETLAVDVDSLKSGMARSGGRLDKIHSELEEQSDKFGSVLTELRNVKIAMYKATTKNKTTLASLTRPISAQTEELRKLKGVVQRMNATMNKSTQKIANELYARNVEINEKVSQLDLKVNTLNFTSNNQFAVLKESADTQMVTLKNSVAFLFNTTGSLSVQVQKHNIKMQNYSQLVSNVERCQNMSRMNSLKIKAMNERVEKHHLIMTNQSNSSGSAAIIELKEQLKELEDMQHIHHRKLEDMQHIHHRKLEQKGESPSTTVPHVTSSSTNKSEAAEDQRGESPSTTTPHFTNIASTNKSTAAQTQHGESPSITTPHFTNSSTNQSEPAQTQQDEAPIITTPLTSTNPIDQNQTVQNKHNESASVSSQPNNITLHKSNQTDGFMTTSVPIATTTNEVSKPVGKSAHSLSVNSSQQGGCTVQCDKTERCSKTRKGYKCLCARGFKRVEEYCEDIDECADSNHVPRCHVNATCSNTFGSYECRCAKGFVGNGKFCIKLDPLLGVTSSHPTRSPLLATSTRDSKHGVTSVHDAPPLATTTAEAPLPPGSLRTPEMPDEKGLYDDDKSSLADEQAKREADKLYRQRVAPNAGGRGSWKGIGSRGFDFLKKIMREGKLKSGKET